MCISADYPYYRDYPENWLARLTSLKSLGIHVITAYIPWRHHVLNARQRPDFSGKSQGNRDVIGFLALCRQLDLMVVLKPGPFIHGETNYGGLPDWVCPLNNPKIEPLLDSEGQPVSWSGGKLDAIRLRAENWPLPAPFAPEFLRLTREWMIWVDEEVIRPNQAPAGPIVALQIANEGIYSNGQHAPWAYDYSASGLTKYHQFLQTRYQTLEKYNHSHLTAHEDWMRIPPPTRWNSRPSLEEQRAFLDWGDFQAEYMRLIFHEWASPLVSSLPVFINQNPPLGEPFGLDAWLTRVEPECWPGVHYGYTNWVGDISANESAFNRYLFTAKRFPGVNLEENWGFAELYDPAYADAATSFYQTLALLNAGATGFNVYTGVATAHRDTNLEVKPKTPYPDAAPVTEHGELTPKAVTVRWLASFMDRFGAEFLACKPLQPLAWGVYLPYARTGAWDWASPNAHGQVLAQFQQQARRRRLDYRVMNLSTASVNDLLAYPRLALCGGAFMHRTVQERLAEYARRGGKLALIGETPLKDENFQPCNLLAEMNGQFTSLTVDTLPEWLPLSELRLEAGSADVWLRSHPENDVHFVTVLIPSHGSTRVQVSFQAQSRAHKLEVVAAPSGGAILRIERGLASAGIIKGGNNFLKQSVAPQCILDGQRCGNSIPGDYAWIGQWNASLAVNGNQA